MRLSSIQLQAFTAVTQTGNFSKAAKKLHITQSALSQRVLNLEDTLETALLIRDPGGIRLTAAGEELLRYCRINEGLESELLTRITSSKNSLGGTVRIAGLSSVLRSTILPALEKLLHESGDTRLELYNRELRDLPTVLNTNEADFIVTSDEPFRQGMESKFLGYEENVLVESKNHTPLDYFLDHDSDDHTTINFLLLNNKKADSIRRHYLDEVYAIIDAARKGYGRAVVPRHLVQNIEDLKIVDGYKPLQIPIKVQYLSQPYYTLLHAKVLEEILANVPELLYSSAKNSGSS